MPRDILMTSPPPPKSKLVYYALGLVVGIAWFVMWIIRTAAT